MHWVNVMKDDPTLTILKRNWSIWKFVGDRKGSAVKGALRIEEWSTPEAHGPGVYELGLVLVNGDGPFVRYVGESHDQTVAQRVHEHARAVTGDKYFFQELSDAYDDGDELWARYILTSPSEAIRLEAELRRLGVGPGTRYPWNRK